MKARVYWAFNGLDMLANMFSGWRLAAAVRGLWELAYTSKGISAGTSFLVHIPDMGNGTFHPMKQ